MPRFESHRFGDRACAAIGLMSAAALLGCSASDASAPQVAAKVNKEEITVYEIDYALSQRRSSRHAEPQPAAAKDALERLIDLELAMQKAQEIKLDHDPRVAQTVGAATREIVARAYADKLGESVPKPSADEVRSYYAGHPELFAERRLYTLHDFVVDVPADQITELRASLEAARSADDFAQSLGAARRRFVATLSVQAAEQLPLDLLPEVARLRDGQSLWLPAAKGAHVVFLVASQTEPLGLAQASGSIELFLLNERRRERVESHLRALRQSARIEYLGSYAESASRPNGSLAAMPLAHAEKLQTQGVK